MAIDAGAEPVRTRSKSADWSGWWKVAVTPFNCSLSDGLRASRTTKPTADFLWSIMAQAYGCYGVYLSGPGGAHAIALTARPGQPVPPLRSELLPHRAQGQGHLHVLRHLVPVPFRLRHALHEDDRRRRYQAADLTVVGAAPRLFQSIPQGFVRNATDCPQETALLLAPSSTTEGEP